MLPVGSRVLAAVSGGPDSVCLLLVLREIAERLGIAVAGVAHVNHHQRGAESDADERFVQAMAGAFGLPFHRHDAPGEAGPGNLEQTLRRARQEFSRSLLAAGHGTHIALGHTRDDQAETVLFRLLRGSGLAGMAGILPVTADRFVRPLLDVTRGEIAEFLRARGVPWCEDSSNREPRFARNRIRHQLLPQLQREWNPRLTQSLARVAELAYEEEKWWAVEVARLRLIQDGEIDVRQLAKLPVALARRVVRQAIRGVSGDLRRIEFDHVERVLELVHAEAGHGRVDLPGLPVVRSFDWIRFGIPPAPAPARKITVPGEYSAPDGQSSIVLEFFPRRACVTLELSWRKLPDGLELRGWKAGDAYRPRGESRERKVKEMFQNTRIPSWRRAGWPILLSEERILWARDFGVAAEFAAESRGKVVRVTARTLIP